MLKNLLEIYKKRAQQESIKLFLLNFKRNKQQQQIITTTKFTRFINIFSFLHSSLFAATKKLSNFNGKPVGERLFVV